MLCEKAADIGSASAVEVHGIVSDSAVNMNVDEAWSEDGVGKFQSARSCVEPGARANGDNMSIFDEDCAIFDHLERSENGSGSKESGHEEIVREWNELAKLYGAYETGHVST